MAGPPSTLVKLNWSRQGLTDKTLPSLRQKSLNYEEVDFSQNEITSYGLREVVDICKRCSGLQILKLYKNQIDDEGARELAELCRHCPWIAEMHLSHNRFTAEGVRVLVQAAARHRPAGAPPLWLRLERNKVEDPEIVLNDLQSRLSVCPRRDEVRCTTRLCCLDRKVHMPYFNIQKGNWGAPTGESHGTNDNHTAAQDSYRCTLKPRTADSPPKYSGQSARKGQNGHGWATDQRGTSANWDSRGGWHGESRYGNDEAHARRGNHERRDDRRGDNYTRHRSRSPAKSSRQNWGNDSWGKSSRHTLPDDRSRQQWQHDRYEGNGHSHVDRAAGNSSRSPERDGPDNGRQAADVDRSASPGEASQGGDMPSADVGSPETGPASSMALPVGLQG